MRAAGAAEAFLEPDAEVNATMPLLGTIVRAAPIVSFSAAIHPGRIDLLNEQDPHRVSRGA